MSLYAMFLIGGIVNSFLFQNGCTSSIVPLKRTDSNHLECITSFTHTIAEKRLSVFASMKFLALMVFCFLVISLTIQSTSARIFSFGDVTVNGTLTKQSNYCDFIGGKKLATFSTSDPQVCAQKCVANQKCTHYRAFGCTLLQSSTCLNINMNTYQSCGYVPDRTCPKQVTTVDDDTKWISFCQ